MNDVRETLQQAHGMLQTLSPTARLDCELLLAQVLHQSRTWLFAHPEYSLSAAESEAFKHLLKKRLAGHPVAYLTGSREFWSLPLEVNDATLIPRPETELLAETALMFLHNHPQASVLDMGTGSGAIAIALAHELDTLQITATDVRLETLETAKRNAVNLRLRNIRFIRSDWYESLPATRYDCIVSNPPYLATDDPHLHAGDVRFEPVQALASGPDGLDAIRIITAGAPRFLLPGGLLLLEHGYAQGQAVRTLFAAAGFAEISTHRDFQGHERITAGSLQTT